MYSFSMCRPHGQVIHVRLEILGGRNVGTSVVERQCRDGGIVHCFKVKRQPILGSELTTQIKKHQILFVDV